MFKPGHSIYILKVIYTILLVHPYLSTRPSASEEDTTELGGYRRFELDGEEYDTGLQDLDEILKENTVYCGAHKQSQTMKRFLSQIDDDEEINPRIAGGYFAKPGEFPSYVGLRSGSIRVISCGGTIIHSRIVVTAAHCIEKSSSVTISTSMKSPSSWTSADKKYSARRGCIPKSYHVRPILGPRHDYGVVILKEDIKFDENVQPVCLPNHTLSKGENAIVAGNGLTETGRVSKSLKALLVKEVPCSSFTGSEFSCFSPRSGGGDSCQGDSGGPVYTLRNNRQYLMGITSYGPDQCKSNVKGLGMYVNPQKERASLLKLISDCYSR